MEVHHPHHPTHKKKWPEYLLEFLMLFLAVFLGFVAENIREHRLEIKMEQEYMSSLVREIKKDIAQIDSIQPENVSLQRSCDSLLIILPRKEIISNSYPAYALWSSVQHGFSDFVPNDGTIEQLRSGSGLRLIKKKDVVDKLMEYYKDIELIRTHQSVMNSYMLQPVNRPDLFDIPRLENSKGNDRIPLLSNDETHISRAYSYIQIWRGLLRVLNSAYFETAKAKGTDLLNTINSEYHLQND
jgi:hypothetical protein